MKRLLAIGVVLLLSGSVAVVDLAAIPSTPIRAAFYYPWFPETWSAGTHYTPALGRYDSSNPTIMAAHIEAMKWGGIQAGIASWWGQGTPTDGRMPALLAAAAGKGFSWTAYYEPEGIGDPTSAQIGSDLVALGRYAADPNWLRVAGKPVLFVYGSGSDGCAMADRWAAAPGRGNWYVVLKVFSGYLACANQPDSWHQYGPASREDRQGSFSFSISPGFWKSTETTPRLARDPVAWNQNVCDMLASGAQWQLVTTFNEWGEGSAVEPATEWQSASGYGRYLDTLRNPQCVTPSPANSPTPPAPTPPPTPSPSPTLPPSPTPSTTPTPVPSASPTPTPIPSSAQSISPTPTPVAGAIRHVVIVWLENHEISAVTPSSMPYLTGIGSTYGTATQYFAVRHPSEPNYLAFWSGSTQGVTDDGTYNLSGASLSSQLAAAGLSWRTYAQDYPTTVGCHTGSSYSGAVDGWGVSGTYARKHNPAMSFTSVSGSSTACGNIQPLARFDPLVNLAFVVPNLCNDAHDCSLATADNFLKAFSPQVFNSPDWAHTLYIVTFDEGSGSTEGGLHVYMAVMRQGLHLTSAIPHNHYGLTRTVEDVFGLPCLNSSCTASPLTEFLP